MNPHHFRPLRGWKNQEYQSFPSGHTAAAFAAASVITSETGRWWPNTRLLTGTVMFSGATMVGIARMYNNRHWASDVVGGAAVGSLIGWWVASQGRDDAEDEAPAESSGPPVPVVFFRIPTGF